MISRNLFVLLVCMLFASFAESDLSSSEDIQRFCTERTGLIANDIKSVSTRNEGCTVDCLTRQGLVLTGQYKDGEECHDKNHKCLLGQCVEKDSVSSDVKDLYSVNIRIISAKVRDEDAGLGQGASDVFVHVNADGRNEPAYRAGDTLCYTYVLQDSNEPKWKFSCKPSPMKKEALLKFNVYDSDKPMIPDFLGSAQSELGDLLNKGPQKLPLYKMRKLEDWLEVEVIGEEYSAPI